MSHNKGLSSLLTFLLGGAATACRGGDWEGGGGTPATLCLKKRSIASVTSVSLRSASVVSAHWMSSATRGSTLSMNLRAAARLPSRRWRRAPLAGARTGIAGSLLQALGGY